MVLLEEGRVCECPRRHSSLRQLVAYVGCAKAISHAHELHIPTSVAVHDSIYPLWNGFIRKRCVLLFPGLVIEIFVGAVVAVLAVFPDRILGCEVKHWGASN